MNQRHSESGIFTEIFDLAVIGGGPAGTSAAITAARSGARVVLLEGGTVPRHKVCGEFISAESLKVLEDLLCQLPHGQTSLRSVPSIGRLRLMLGERALEANISPAALSVPRHILDAILWEAALHAGVEARMQCEVTSVEGEGPFSLRTRECHFQARSLIIAAGRWSRFTMDRAVPPGPKWIGVKAHQHEERPPRETDLYFFEHGYCGVQPVADNVVNVCAMVRSDQATSLNQIFALHPGLARRAAGWSAMTSPISTAPLTYRVPQPVHQNALLVGDAAGFIDPFVGDGISIALQSGVVAAQCLAIFLSRSSSLGSAAATYNERYRRLFAPLLSAAARVRALLRLPALAQTLAFEALRLPGVMPLVIRKTRRSDRRVVPVFR